MIYYIFFLACIASQLVCSTDEEIINSIRQDHKESCRAIKKEMNSPLSLGLPGHWYVIDYMCSMSNTLNSPGAKEILDRREDVKVEFSGSFEKAYNRVLEAPGEYFSKSLWYAAGALGCFGLLKYQQESLTHVEWWGCASFGAYSAMNFLANGTYSWLTWRSKKDTSYLEKDKSISIEEYAKSIRSCLWVNEQSIEKKLHGVCYEKTGKYSGLD